MAEELPNRKLPDGTLGGPVIGRQVRSETPDWSITPRGTVRHLTHSNDEAALCGRKAPNGGWLALLTFGEASQYEACTACVEATAPPVVEAPVPVEAPPPAPEPEPLPPPTTTDVGVFNTSTRDAVD